ncbi:MAG: hypothetical protein ABSE18_03440 [Minisyncoccia bacterium]|jgi:hypothetical protein
MWKQWVNFLLGLLVVIFTYVTPGHTIRFVIAGLAIALLSLWSALKKNA